MSAAANIADVLGGKRNGPGFIARCPAHDDHDPSLSISETDDGRPLVKCHAGCGQKAVIEALRQRGAWPERATDSGMRHPSLGEPETVWTYRDAQGRALGYVCRWTTRSGKDIRPYVGGHWQQFEVPRPLYGLDRLAQYPDAPVIVYEGEKAADAAQRLLGSEYVSVTWPGGSKAVDRADWSALNGRAVYVWPDADDAGRKAAESIERKIPGARIIQPPTGKPPGWDAADAEREGVSADEITAWLATASAPSDLRDDSLDGPDSKTPRFELIRAGELEAAAPAWIIRRYLERDSVAMIYGDPGTGKSFLAIDWACSIAAGRDYLAHEVRQAPVIYIAGEGRNGLARRLRAWSIRTGQALDELPLFVSTGPAALTDAESAHEVREAVDNIAAAEGQPGLVVIDTLARNFGPGDENSTQDMTIAINAIDSIRTAHGATVLLVHHTGHHDKTRARGAMALKGALDAEYRLDKDETGVVRMEATKMKDAQEPEPVAFRIRTVEMGFQDDEGEDVTSAILDPVDYTPPAMASKAGRGKNQTLALEVLHRLHREHRERRQDGGHDPEGARVSLQDWRSAMGKAGLPRSSTYEIPRTLREAGAVTMENGFVWPAE